MADFKSIPIPKRMKALARDARGYPVPFIVVRDSEGLPVFAANDSVRQRKALYEKRCPICGTTLDRIFWLVGGIETSFHNA